jgi:hypothetical protein
MGFEGAGEEEKVVCAVALSAGVEAEGKEGFRWDGVDVGVRMGLLEVGSESARSLLGILFLGGTGWSPRAERAS